MYYVFHEKHNNEAYWTGEFRESGRPCWTRDVAGALGFTTPAAAYSHCAPYKTLQSWRVGKRAA